MVDPKGAITARQDKSALTDTTSNREQYRWTFKEKQKVNGREKDNLQYSPPGLKALLKPPWRESEDRKIKRKLLEP